MTFPAYSNTPFLRLKTKVSGIAETLFPSHTHQLGLSPPRKDQVHVPQALSLSIRATLGIRTVCGLPGPVTC